MSQENVELVRNAITAYNRRDFEAMRAMNRPDVQVDWSASRGLEAGVYRGWEEVKRFYQGFFETFEEVKLEPDRFVESGDSVVVPNSARIRGRDGMQTVARSAFIFEIQDGQIARICLFQETHEALEAVGLSELGAENVEIVREQFAATNRKDFARPMADWADDVELTAVDGMNAGTCAGREAVGEFFGDWFRAFGAGVHFDVQEIVGARDVVAVKVHHRARGRHSGAEVEGDFFYEYRLREGKIFRIKFHRSWQDALEALAPSEDEAHSEFP
jgi:uncharacterized protein